METCHGRFGGSERLGGPDSLTIGPAKPQDVLHAMQNPSRACGTPIAELSGPPAQHNGTSTHCPALARPVAHILTPFDSATPPVVADLSYFFFGGGGGGTLGMLGTLPSLLSGGFGGGEGFGGGLGALAIGYLLLMKSLISVQRRFPLALDPATISTWGNVFAYDSAQSEVPFHEVH